MSQHRKQNIDLNRFMDLYNHLIPKIRVISFSYLLWRSPSCQGKNRRVAEILWRHILSVFGTNRLTGMFRMNELSNHWLQNMFYLTFCCSSGSICVQLLVQLEGCY